VTAAAPLDFVLLKPVDQPVLVWHLERATFLPLGLPGV